MYVRRHRRKQRRDRRRGRSSDGPRRAVERGAETGSVDVDDFSWEVRRHFGRRDEAIDEGDDGGRRTLDALRRMAPLTHALDVARVIAIILRPDIDRRDGSL